MIVASGPPGREVVHFEAPAASQVLAEMARFLTWFEDKADATDQVLKAAVAHIWFVTIHPFDDGNGRIGGQSLIWPLPARKELVMGQPT